MPPLSKAWKPQSPRDKLVVGTTPPKIGDKTTPQNLFLAIFHPWVVLCHLGLVLSSHLGGCFYGPGGYHPFGVVLSPLFRGGFIPPPIGCGVVTLLSGGLGSMAHLYLK